jgi:hypothetical protein
VKNALVKFIAKKDLIDGAYYQGDCRNASVARWDMKTNSFYHWRTKFGSRFIEEINHPDDDQVYDVFIPESVIEHPEEEIPLPKS